MKDFNIKEFLSELNANKFVNACNIPLGYKAGYPIVKNIGSRVLLLVPYRKYKNTDKENKFAVMPIEYIITFELHAPINVPESIKNAVNEKKLCVNANPAGFESLKNNDKFSDFSFDRPVGIFPSNSLERLGIEEYRKKVNKIYTAYDAVINDALGIKKASGVDKMEFKALLNELIEPGLKPMYQMLDKAFAEKYLN